MQKPGFGPLILWTKSLHLLPHVISNIKAEGPFDSRGLLEVHGCLTFSQPPNDEQLRFPFFMFFLRSNEARCTWLDTTMLVSVQGILS